MTEEAMKIIHENLERAVADAKQGYYAGTVGYSYDDMRAAAQRLLEWRATMEKALYGQAVTRVTRRTISNYLR